MTYYTRESDYGWRVDYCTRCHQERTCECIHHPSAGEVHANSPEAIADCDVCHAQNEATKEAMSALSKAALRMFGG